MLKSNLFKYKRKAKMMLELIYYILGEKKHKEYCVGHKDEDTEERYTYRAGMPINQDQILMFKDNGISWDIDEGGDMRLRVYKKDGISIVDMVRLIDWEEINEGDFNYCQEKKFLPTLEFIDKNGVRHCFLSRDVYERWDDIQDE